MESADSLTDYQPDITMRTAPIQQPTLDPVAHPTPIRYSPPALARNPGLDDLARGLSAFDSGLSDFLDARQKQNNIADALQAQADFAKNNGKGYADAVEAGTVPASASPAYVNAYKEAQGKLAGQMLEQKFQAAYDAWDGKNNIDDPNAYSKFAQDFFSRNIGTSDPAVLAGLMPVVHEVAANGMKQHIEDQHRSVVQGYSDTQSALLSNHIAAAVGYANSSGNPVDPNYIAGSVGDAYNSARAVGVSPDVAQKNAIIAITTAALLNKAHHGDEILQSLDIPLPGSGIRLSDTPYGAEEKLRAQNALDAYQREQVVQSQKQQSAENKLALGVVEQRVVGAIAKDPLAPVNEDDLKEGSKYDPTFRVKVAQWQDTLSKNAGTSDVEGMNNLMRDIMNGAGMEAVSHALDTGVIRNPHDLQLAQNEVGEHAKAGPVMQQLVSSEPYKSVLSTIKLQTSATGDADPFGVAGLSPQGLGLQYELNKRMQSWASQNPGATYEQVQEQFGKTAKDILSLITQPATKTFPGGAVSLPSDNPYAQPPQPGAAPSAPPPSASPTPGPAPAPPAPVPQPAIGPAGEAPFPQQGAAPSPSTSSPPASPFSPPSASSSAAARPDPRQVQAWIDSLPQNQKDNLAAAAQRSGRNPVDIATETYLKQLQSTQAAPPTATPTPATPAAPGTSAQPVQYQPGASEKFGDAIAKWRATDPNAEQVIHQFAGILAGMHAALPYQGSTTLAAIKDNPQAAHLLDFVAGPESGGNYNAYWGHADNTKTDLTAMTLNEVMHFQHNLVALDHQPSSAAGRYQFMPDTLQGLIKQMGLTGTERFTPEMQDQLAVQLLKNRGLEQWQRGELSDTQFMNNLAYEWASLPNPHTGKSQYDGYGPNHALVTPGQVGKVIGEAKSMATGDTNLGVPPPPPAAAQANSNAGAMVFGDSLGDGVRSVMKAQGDTQVGRQPAVVLQSIKGLPNNALVGKGTIVLSSGMSNNPSADISVVSQQIDALKAKGANPAAIRLLGVGDRSDYVANKLNDKLAALAAEKGVRFLPLPTLPAGEHVHPDMKGYADIAQRATAQFVADDNSGTDNTEE